MVAASVRSQIFARQQQQFGKHYGVVGATGGTGSATQRAVRATRRFMIGPAKTRSHNTNILRMTPARE
jgi:hypothetical protein